VKANLSLGPLFIFANPTLRPQKSSSEARRFTALSAPPPVLELETKIDEGRKLSSLFCGTGDSKLSKNFTKSPPIYISYRIVFSRV
jgi:hypothetical protein